MGRHRECERCCCLVAAAAAAASASMRVQLRGLGPGHRQLGSLNGPVRRGEQGEAWAWPHILVHGRMYEGRP